MGLLVDDIHFIHSLKKTINTQLDNLSLNVTSGGIDSFDKYKYITGQISALESVLQEISNLLNKKEQYDRHEGNVIVIDINGQQRYPKD